MPSTPPNHRSLVAELSATAARLETLFEDLSNFERVWRPAQGKWSCTEVVGHLADAELVFGYRIRSAMAEPGRTLEAFDQDKWVVAERWNDLPAENALRLFATLRSATLVLLNALPEEGWMRHYIHSARGPQTIADTATLLVSHDARHLVQLGRTAEEAHAASLRGTRGASR